MPRIQVLSDLLVNKIAAGEVIERPASVVKELVENSLDAGARHIEIAIEQGGQKLIRVTDDGEGMGREDLALCIYPHATSKIQSEDDLTRIRTMGFRGEALASIASIAQMRIVSRRRDTDEAHEIRAAGDRIEPLSAAAGPPGTSIEIRELFFNVPARQKFLRTAQTEMGHISEQVARIALVHPEVEFRVTHNGRVVHHLRATDQMRGRIADFFGRELAENLLSLSRSERGLTISGLAGLPADSRSSQKWQYIFLNGRYIRDRFISHAVREAYRGLMDPSRYPVIFLALTVNPDTVDVNVHPTKIEVRWRDSNIIYSQVLSCLRDRFLNADLTANLKMGPSPADTPDKEEGESEEAAEARRREIRESIADFFKRATPIIGPGSSPDASPSFGGSPRIGPSAGFSHRSFAPSFPPVQATGSFIPEQTLPAYSVKPEAPAAGQAIQIHNTYLVAETGEGVVIIDQHALHERILFEQLSEQFSRGPLEAQRLLIPETVEVSPDQIAVIEEHEETLERLGFELSPYGPGTLAIHAAPTLLKEERMADFARDMLDRLADQSNPTSTEQIINDLLSMMACKAAVKAGDRLTAEEITALMVKRHLVDRGSNCPHGRPTSLRLSIDDLEKQFKRV